MSKLIEINELSKKYDKKVALNNVSLSLESGKIVGLLGPNGSGKTTFMKILAGLIKSHAGTVQIDGHSVGKITKSIVAYLPDQDIFSENMKVSKIMKTYQDFFADFDVQKATNLLEQLSIPLNVRVRTLSKGQREKLQLVLIMSRNAKVYVLDEPIGAVDPAAKEVILDLILNNYSEDALVLISTHSIHDIETIFDEVIFMKEGEVLFHQDAEELRHMHQKSIEELFKEVYTCSNS